jgi:hypothetical protein
VSQPFDRSFLKDTIIALPQTVTMSADGYIPVITIVAGELFVRRITPDDFKSVVAGGVSSVFGRQGTVIAQAGDYALADITGLVAALAGKSNTGHGHAQSDITNLVADLAALSSAIAAKAALSLVQPDAITGPANLTGQAQNVTVESADFTFTNADTTGVYSLTVRSSIAAANAEIRVNGLGSWSQHVNIRHSDVLRLRMLTANAPATQRVATIYTPGRNFTWATTTT